MSLLANHLATDNTKISFDAPEAIYRFLVENSQAAFYVIQDGLFTFVNKSFCELSGYTYDEIIDRMGPTDLVHPREHKIVLKTLEKYLNEEKYNCEQTLDIIRKDGQIIRVQIAVNFSINNEKPMVSGSIIDISKENDLESQLLQAQKMEAIGNLAGGIAHDFNNIITILAGYGNLLQLNIDKSDPSRHYVDQILLASQKAASLTQKLLTFSRQQPIALKPLNINTIINETKNLLERLITEDIRLTTDLSPEDVIIMADPTQIDQILFNLIVNAKDAMPSGGDLKLSTRTGELDEEFVKTHGFGKPGRYAVIEVSDTGTGINKDTIEKIYNPFFTTKEVGKGTGLGLSTVYGILKQHKGYITVFSKPDQGATFSVYFPIVKSMTHAMLPSDIRQIRSGKEVILVAEDDDDVRYFIIDILNRFGYKAIGAKDGTDAISKYRENKDISLIVMDSIMPRKNGKEVCDCIKQIQPDIKILFMSGYSSDILADKGLLEHEVEYIEKPIYYEDFIQKVRSILDK
ncbi:MAG: PAS domain S-box protein [Proteobacteria bacterium]|nr:PAS domain S-box protein [Pseudomonadota bacterium]